MSLKSVLKSSYRESVDSTLNSISSIQTLLHNYPVVETTGNLLVDGNTECSLSFMMSILAMFGKTQTEVVEMFVDMLCGKDDNGESGILSTIEEATKVLLMANMKNLTECLNPLIPDRLMLAGENDVLPDPNGNGIEISIEDIDLFNMLGYCPTSANNGSVYYFDGLYSIFTGQMSGVANHMWRSCDFNAYLWYIIHRSTSSDHERHLYWDNRCTKNTYKRLMENESLRNRFFDVEDRYDPKDIKSPYQTLKDGGDSVKRYGIIRCEYEERSTTSDKTNVIRVYINPWRYANSPLSFKIPTLNNTVNISTRVNRTLFQFNYEYIWSLKLFNTKTLVAQILNSVFGLASTINMGFSYSSQIIKDKVGEMVYRIMADDDLNDTMDVIDCFNRFDNKKYDELIRNTEKKYTGQHTYIDDTDDGFNAKAEELNRYLSALNDIESATTQVEQKRTIMRIFNDIIVTKDLYSERFDDKLSFNYGSFIIDKLIKETVLQIVLQVLSPKVAILFKINNAVMGDTDDTLDSWENFINNFQETVADLVLQVKEIILQWILSYIMTSLKEILDLYILELLKEAIADYRNLLKNIIDGCTNSFGSSILFKLLSNKRKYSNMQLDNVNYADILPTALPKTKDSC